jgi:ABC-type branched-subunit amino acid transport system substrate-binding protein
MKPTSVGLVCLMSAVACHGGTSTLTIGAMLSQTGTVGSAGLDHLLAVQLAVDEINAAGGVLGHTLAVVNEDDHSDETRAAAAVQALIDGQHVPAIIGGISSGSTLRAAMVTVPRQVVLASGASTSTLLTGLSPYFFRTCPSDALQGQLLAKRAVAKGFMRVAIAFVPSAYGMGLSDAFSADFAQLGGTVTVALMMPLNQSSYRTLLQQIFATNPDAVLLVNYAVDATQIIRDYVSAYALQQTFWFFTDSTQDSSFVAGVGASNFGFPHEGTGSATPSGPAYDRLASAFQARYGKLPEGFSPHHYDATYLVALSMQEAGKSDGPSLQSHIRRVADPPGIVFGPGDWAAARAAIQAGSKVNYEGASGSVDVDGNGDVIAPYDIWQVQGGQIVPIAHSVMP